MRQYVMRIIKKKQTAIETGTKFPKWPEKVFVRSTKLPIVCGKKTLPRCRNLVKAA